MKGGSTNGHRAAGFTIVETLIVLAVTGLIFFSAVLAMQGKVGRTEFLQAINETQTQIQQIINDTANGYYPLPSTAFSCDTTASGSIRISATGSQGQGEHSKCTFIGKVIQFRVQGTNPEQYAVYSLVGLRCASGALGVCETPSTVGAARPIALYPYGSTVPTTIDASTVKPLANGLRTRWIQYNGTNNTGAVGFIADPTTLAGSVYDVSKKSAGTQATTVHIVQGTALNQTRNAVVGRINTPSNLRQPDDGVRICFDSPSGDQSGLIAIGAGQDQETSVTLTIFEGTNCT